MTQLEPCWNRKLPSFHGHFLSACQLKRLGRCFKSRYKLAFPALWSVSLCTIDIDFAVFLSGQKLVNMKPAQVLTGLLLAFLNVYRSKGRLLFQSVSQTFFKDHAVSQLVLFCVTFLFFWSVLFC